MLCGGHRASARPQQTERTRLGSPGKLTTRRAAGCPQEVPQRRPKSLPRRVVIPGRKALITTTVVAPQGRATAHGRKLQPLPQHRARLRAAEGRRQSPFEVQLPGHVVRRFSSEPPTQPPTDQACASCGLTSEAGGLRCLCPGGGGVPAGKPSGLTGKACGLCLSPACTEHQGAPAGATLLFQRDKMREKETLLLLPEQVQQIKTTKAQTMDIPENHHEQQ